MYSKDYTEDYEHASKWGRESGRGREGGSGVKEEGEGEQSLQGMEVNAGQRRWQKPAPPQSVVAGESDRQKHLSSNYTAYTVTR